MKRWAYYSKCGFSIPWADDIPKDMMDMTVEELEAEG